MAIKKTKPARNVTPKKNTSDKVSNDYFDQFDDDYWQSVTGGTEKREEKRKPKMAVSGKSVLKLKKIIEEKLPVHKKGKTRRD